LISIEKFNKVRFSLTAVFILLLSSFYNVQAQSQYKSEAELYFKNKVYDEALENYLKYIAQKPKDKKVYDQIAVCHIENGQPEQALKFLKLLLQENKIQDEWLLHNAQALHLNNDFKNAIKYYKSYLTQLSSGKEYERQLVKDDIKRCVNGFRLQRLPKLQVIVENLDNTVNTSKNEFAPIVSPNHSNKIYFSAVKEDNIGNRYDESGNINPIYGQPNSDIFFTTKENGEWMTSERMSVKINSESNDVLMDFAANGQALYSNRGATPKEKEIFFDRFYQEFEIPEPIKFDKNIEQAYSKEDDLFFFSENTLLFSSNRLEGYGGYDLYYSIYNVETDSWGTAVNLGGSINTPYDEKDPFLAKDGRTLYFSANNLNSIGGFDIFTARFNDSKGVWTNIKNMGLSINSANDEENFRLTKEANVAYYNSDQPGGKGGQDIYSVFYKSKQDVHLTSSEPSSFIEIKELLASQGVVDNSVAQVEDNTSYKPTNIERVNIRELYYNEGESILNVNNKNVLKKIANVLKSYPTVRLTINSHADNTSNVPFSLYTSYEKGKEVFDYMISEGAISTNMTINAHGNVYPAAINNQELGQKLNRSIYLKLEETKGLPLRVSYNESKISDILKASNRDAFLSKNKGLTYKIEIKKTNKLFNEPLLDKQEDVVAESNGLSDVSYCVGLYKTYTQAVNARNQFSARNPNYANAFLVPFVNGIRVQEEDLVRYAELFPDLYRYINN